MVVTLKMLKDFAFTHPVTHGKSLGNYQKNYSELNTAERSRILKIFIPYIFLSVFDSTDWVHMHQAHTRNAMIVLHLLIRMDSLATNRYKYT